jgi:hypothetical protein
MFTQIEIKSFKNKALNNNENASTYFIPMGYLGPTVVHKDLSTRGKEA